MENEKRLIDANAAVKVLRGKCVAKYPNTFLMGLLASASEIEQIPTVDAVEVVHGRWIVDAVEVDHPFLEFESVWRDVHQCSICKEYFDVSDARNYCPNCGAKMDGGNEDG